MSEQILDIENGKLAIFTDIHGNLDVYERALEVAKVNKIIPVFAGDLVHKVNPSYQDNSKCIIDDLIGRVERRECVALLGNHELAHIYEMPWIDDEGFKTFEEAIKGDRSKYIDFFMSMPYVVRTKNVFINHNGTIYAPLVKVPIKLDQLKEKGLVEKKLLTENKELVLELPFGLVYNINEICDELDHKKIFNENREDYEQLSKEEKENYGGLGEYTVSSLDGRLLLALFSGQNDIDYSKGAQKEFIDYTLKLFSDKRPMSFLVSGHIHTYLFERLYNQLRFSTGTARMSNRCFLTIEAGREYSSMHELTSGLEKLSGSVGPYNESKTDLESNLNLLKSFLNPREEQALDLNKAEFTQERGVLYLREIGGGYNVIFNGAHFIVTPEIIVEE